MSSGSKLNTCRILSLLKYFEMSENSGCTAPSLSKSGTTPSIDPRLPK